MNIRLNYGPRQGEVQFVRPDVARNLLATGRATTPDEQPRVIADNHADNLADSSNARPDDQPEESVAAARPQPRKGRR